MPGLDGLIHCITATRWMRCNGSCARFRGTYGHCVPADLRGRKTSPPQERESLEDPAKRLFINDAVCEGCGDCSGASPTACRCVPKETPLGRKRQHRSERV